MIVRPHEHVPIARLLTFLMHGEHMAAECARRQAVLASDAGTRRFLNNQASQETMHAYVFKGAIAWLAPRHLGALPVLTALEQFRSLLCEALDRGDLIESILAEQVVLEGLGETILTRIEQGLHKRAAPFGRIRRMLLLQEEAHHAFGLRLLERAMAENALNLKAMRGRAQEYLGLCEAMVLALCDVFDTIDEDATAWAADVRTFVPTWLTP